ncbi:MAG: hypothetical protein OXP75_03445 [Rhodospirillales bacterium]|nr:hypothetical protein [Rhodospirillales bacterium]
MKKNEIGEDTLRIAKIVAVAIAISSFNLPVNATETSNEEFRWRMPTAHLVQYTPQWVIQQDPYRMQNDPLSKEDEAIRSIESIQQLYAQKRIRHMEFVM